MPPAEEATFIQLWNQGLDIATIAQRLGIPPSQLVEEFLWQVLTDRRSSIPERTPIPARILVQEALA
jgi:hypothetical protein